MCACLCGDVDSSVWDVQVADDEDEAGCHDGGVGLRLRGIRSGRGAAGRDCACNWEVCGLARGDLGAAVVLAQSVAAV